MIDYIKAYLKYDPASKSFLEVLLLYPGPKAIFLYRIAHFFYRIQFYFFARLISEIARFLTGIEIHPGAKIGKRCVIDHGLGIVIGETTEIGDDCLILQGVTLGGIKFDPVKRHPTIGNKVLIGAGAKILGPVEIGDHCRIGINAIVTESMPSGAKAVACGFSRECY